MTSPAPTSATSGDADSAPASHPCQHLVRCLRIDGDLDAGTARQALASTVRTTRPAGEPRVDFAEVTVTADEAEAVAVREASAPFALPGGPLLRLRLLHVSDRSRLLLAVAHRSLLGPGGLDRLLLEHACAYNALRRGEPLPRRPPPTAPPLHAAPAGELTRATAPAPSPPPLELPTDRPRHQRSLRRSSVERFRITPDVASALRALSGSSSGDAAVYAAAAVLLAGHSCQSTVPVLVPVGPRGAEATTAAPAPEAVLSLRLDDDPTFRELVARARAALDRLQASAATTPEPADRQGAREELDGTAEASVRFDVRERPADTLRYEGTRCTAVPLHLGTAVHDLAFTLMLDDGEPHGTLEYDTDLFEQITARRLVRRLENLLTAAVRQPGGSVAELPLLPPEERNLVIAEWNATGRAFPRNRTTASFFEEQVVRDPSATAVESEDGSLTYGELDARANRLAHRLVGMGVVPDQPVGMCLPRSVSAVVTLIGIVKAGGAYLPLDPGSPADRLTFMVEDAQARVVVTDDEHAAIFDGADVRVLRHEEPAPGRAAPELPAPGPEIAATADNLAYVIYTSGSTGVPKGVAVAHRALARLAKGADYVELGPGEAHLHLSPLSFDASLIEVWGALLNGGTLVLPPGGLPFPESLKASLQRHRVTTLLLVSPQLHVAAEQFPEDLARVRQLLVGGDVLAPVSAARLLTRLTDTRLLHVYGPTECTLFATSKLLDTVDTTRPTVPIGRPIANTRTYVLDDSQNPAPIGVPGHLWLGGEGLARGYLGRPELTAEHFLPDPFGAAGERMYRTGDRARWLPDGDLEFLGRSDDQVKIRGYRIEPGEIDAALAAHADVRAVATMVRDDAPGGRGLVAYLVGRPRPDDELRDHLRSRLPSYMVPTFFVWLAVLPLTPHGKVDRRALPAPDLRETGDTPGVPHGPLEQQIVAVIAATLGVRTVSAEDDFFDVGGNSLLLVDVFRQLDQQFPAAGLTLIDLLEHRTAVAIAALVSTTRDGS